MLLGSLTSLSLRSPNCGVRIHFPPGSPLWGQVCSETFTPAGLPHTPGLTEQSKPPKTAIPRYHCKKYAKSERSRGKFSLTRFVLFIFPANIIYIFLTFSYRNFKSGSDLSWKEYLGKSGENGIRESDEGVNISKAHVIWVWGSHKETIVYVH